MNHTKKCLLVFFIFFFSRNSNSQIPPDRALLHFTDVYFEENFVSGAVGYELSVYADSMKVKLLKKSKNKIPAFTVNDMEWGQVYWWEIRNFDLNDKTLTENKTHSFRIRKKINSLNIEDTRLDVRVNKTEKNAGGYIVLDYARAIFDRLGNQVWSAPDIKGMMNERKQIRDLKVTCDNTITFLGGNVPVEIDFDGHVLWKAPSPFLMGSDTIMYHHDFKKMENGHYFVLGNKKVDRKVQGNFSEELIKTEHNMFRIRDTLVKKTFQGLLLEFDQNGNLVWFWDASNYVTDEDLNFKKSESGLPTFGTHLNAFSVNRSGTKVYLGFRDLSRIIRVDKKTKKVEFSYGEKYPSGEGRAANNLFRGQHDASITDHKSILIFNNNNDQRGGVGLGSVLEIKDVSAEKDSRLLWNFELNFDTLTNGKSSAAGNIDELPNGNLLVCGGMMPRIFEVTKSKEIVWDAFVHSRSSIDSAWNLFSQYRAHWTPRLYYYHFLARIESQIPKSKGAVEVNLQLYNTGNVEDSYLIEVLNSKNETVSTIKTKSIKPYDLSGTIHTFKVKALASQCIKISSAHSKPLYKFLSLDIK